MKKLIKILILSLFAIILIVGTVLQIDIERYISKQQNDYNILHERNRLKYKPALFYYLENRTLNKRSNHIIYYTGEFRSHFSRGIYDEYITECYYTDNEKINFIIEYFTGFPITAELHKDEKFQDFINNELHKVIDEISRYRLPSTLVVLNKTMPVSKYPDDFNPEQLSEPLPPGVNTYSRNFLNLLVSLNKLDSTDAEFMFNSIDSSKVFKIDSSLLSVSTITPEDLDNIFKNIDMDIAYNSLQSKYGTRCFLKIGTPIYNENITKLILHIDNYCGPLHGQGYVFVLEMKNLKWRIIYETGTWVS